MMGYSAFLYDRFISALGFAPTSCQDNLLRSVSGFLASDDGDILVVCRYRKDHGNRVCHKDHA